jgi:hypothetical protein
VAVRKFLGGTSDVLLFNRVPIPWLFDFMKFSVLIVFVFTAVMGAYNVLSKRDSA